MPIFEEYGALNISMLFVHVPTCGPLQAKKGASKTRKIQIYSSVLPTSTKSTVMLTYQCNLYMNPHVGCVKQNTALDYAQKFQIPIILRMRKVLFGHLLASGTFCSIQWFC